LSDGHSRRREVGGDVGQGDLELLKRLVGDRAVLPLANLPGRDEPARRAVDFDLVRIGGERYVNVGADP
jgi:hypothetical protein